MNNCTISLYSKGYLNIVKWLITETRCDVNIRTKYGNYPLHLACR